MDLSYHTAKTEEGWKQPCASCRQIVRDGDKDLEIELEWGEESNSSLYRRVWHKKCYEDWLDQGEEY